MALMVRNTVKSTLQRMVYSLRNDVDITPYLNGVWIGYGPASSGYSVDFQKVSISIFPVSSGPEERLYLDISDGNSLLPTKFLLICDSKYMYESDSFLPEIADDEESRMGMIDYFGLITNALVERPWFDDWEGVHQGWSIQTVDWLEDVMSAGGIVDPDVRRFTITIIVNCFMDRLEGAT